jgi:phosphatidylethanolamine/phosphatidyl-N-methylethanolamine N-methyltransferase
MNENIQFLQAFLKNPLKVGAVAPSSPDLAWEMLEGILPDENNVIVELGVGTGAITKYIREILPDEKSYLGIELDKDMTAGLKVRFPGMNIVCGNACEATAIHEASGLGKVSYILCCLPFLKLPEDIAAKVLGEIEKFMQKGCMFRAFQYAHGYYTPAAIRLRKFMRDRYGYSKRSKLIANNLPPAYTLTWSTLQADRGS